MQRPLQLLNTRRIVMFFTYSSIPRRFLRHLVRGLVGIHSLYELSTRQLAIATLSTGGLNGFIAFIAYPNTAGFGEPILRPFVNQPPFTAHCDTLPRLPSANFQGCRAFPPMFGLTVSVCRLHPRF